MPFRPVGDDLRRSQRPKTSLDLDPGRPFPMSFRTASGFEGADPLVDERSERFEQLHLGIAQVVEKGSMPFAGTIHHLHEGTERALATRLTTVLG